MVGIASLATQQAPGQAPMPGTGQPMPGMLPKPTAATPEAEVNRYVGKSTEELIALFQQRPTGPLMSEIENRLQAEDTQAAFARQMAMGQAAQMGNMSLKDVLQQKLQMRKAQQPTRMAAQGGIMQGYAGGGAVAFATGGDPEEEKLRQQIRDMFESASSPFNILGPRAGQERQRAQDIIRMLPNLDKEQMRNILGQTQRMVDPTAYQDFGPGERTEKMAPPVSVPFGRGMAAERSRATMPSATTFDITNPSSINALRMAAQDTSLPEAERADLQRRISVMERQSAAPTAPAASQNATPADLPPTLLAAMKEREDQLRGRLTRPESLTKAEEGIAALAKSNIEAQQAEAKTYGEEIRAARDAALAKAQRDISSDPLSLMAIAGSIDTRRGQGAGSLARGISSLMGEREKQAEAARKEYALAQRDERAMQANIRQTQMLEAQRQLALKQGRMKDVNDINDQLSRLSIERENFRITRGDKAFEQALEGRKVGAQERQARAAEISAGKPMAQEFLKSWFEKDPKGFNAFIEAQNEPKSASAMRRVLMEQWSKNLMLQSKFPNFDDFVATMTPEASGTGAAAGEFKVLGSRPK